MEKFVNICKDSPQTNSNTLTRWKEPSPLKEIDRPSNTPRQLRDYHFNDLEKIASESRVLIIEGISGSGKDTFQTYLKNRLTGRNVYDYSEGEVLQSWNQLQIGGIFKLRIEFMKHFVDYIKDAVSRDEKTLFLLNRFHLSAYAMTIMQEPSLESAYDEIIDVLRTLPIHVFILRLDETEIEKRSLHPERAGAWQKFQQEIVKKEGFRCSVDRYLWQQRLMIETAERQNLPFSVIKLSPAEKFVNDWIRVSQTPTVARPGKRTNIVNAKESRRHPHIPRTL